MSMSPEEMAARAAQAQMALTVAPYTTQYNAARSVKEPVLPVKYSINLMWLNKTRVDNQAYLLSNSCGRNSTVDSCLSEVCAWKRSNPEAEVNLWFDSEYTMLQAIQNTRNKLTSMGASDVSLRDIRDIPIVRSNADSFSDNVPIYFRIDLMKFIICLYSIENDHKVENLFFQVMENPNVLDALKFVINLCLNTATTTLKIIQKLQQHLAMHSLPR